MPKERDMAKVLAEREKRLDKQIGGTPKEAKCIKEYTLKASPTREYTFKKGKRYKAYMFDDKVKIDTGTGSFFSVLKPDKFNEYYIITCDHYRK